MTDLPNLGVPEYVSLRGGVMAAIRSAILDGTLPPGERLVEATIAEQLGVSRAPVREAIMELSKQGLVKNIPRRGAYVIEWSPDEIEEIYTFRMALEGLAARLAAERATPEQCAEMQEVINSIRGNPDVPYSVKADLRFHELIGEASGHARLQEALSELRTQTELFIRRTRARRGRLADPDALANQHQTVLQAVRAGDATLAEQLMREHIETSGLRLIRGVTRWKAAPDQQAASPSTETRS